MARVHKSALEDNPAVNTSSRGPFAIVKALLTRWRLRASGRSPTRRSSVGAHENNEQAVAVKKAVAGARREAMEELARSTNRSCEDLMLLPRALALSQIVTRCNCNHFAPIRNRGVTAIPQRPCALSQLAALFSGRTVRSVPFGRSAERIA